MNATPTFMIKNFMSLFRCLLREAAVRRMDSSMHCFTFLSLSMTIIQGFGATYFIVICFIGTPSLPPVCLQKLTLCKFLLIQTLSTSRVFLVELFLVMS